MERAAPQELSQKRSRRQIIIRYTLEVFQELKQPVSLSIFLAILRNLLQQRLCLRLDYSQLIKRALAKWGATWIISIRLAWNGNIHLFSPALTEGQR